jgi:predicted phosphodiesterase
MSDNTIAIISDIHGNLTALKAVLDDIKKNKDEIDQILCLGDLVGYNPEPEKTINLVKKSCDIVIGGNHDKSMVDEVDTRWFKYSIKKSIQWTKENLSKESLTYLDSLNLREDITIGNYNLILAHGSPKRSSPFQYIFNEYDIKNIEPLIFNSNILFIGHTHVPSCYYNQGEGWKKNKSKDIEINPSLHYVINVGSVGQPRDGNPKSSYVIFNPTNNYLEFKRVEYNIEEVKQKFNETDLPREFADRLEQGI